MSHSVNTIIDVGSRREDDEERTRVLCVRKPRKQVKIVLGVIIGLICFQNIQATHINNGNMSVRKSRSVIFMATTITLIWLEKVNTTEARGNSFKQKVSVFLDNKTYNAKY